MHKPSYNLTSYANTVADFIVQKLILLKKQIPCDIIVFRGDFLEILVGFAICFIVILALAIYIAKVLKQNKIKPAGKSFTSERTYEIKDEFLTVTVQAKVIDLLCKAELVGIKRPKATEIFTVVFETDSNEIIKITVPKEMYDGLEIGQQGELTIVEGELYSFVI